MPIDPNTGVITPDGTQRQIDAQNLKNTLIAESFRNAPSIGGPVAPPYGTGINTAHDTPLIRFITIGFMIVGLGITGSLARWAALGILGGHGSIFLWTVGIVGACLFVSIGVSILKDSWRLLKEHPIATVLLLILAGWLFAQIASLHLAHATPNPPAVNVAPQGPEQPTPRRHHHR